MYVCLYLCVHTLYVCITDSRSLVQTRGLMLVCDISLVICIRIIDSGTMPGHFIDSVFKCSCEQLFLLIMQPTLLVCILLLNFIVLLSFCDHCQLLSDQ